MQQNKIDSELKNRDYFGILGKRTTPDTQKQQAASINGKGIDIASYFRSSSAKQVVKE